MDNKRNRKRNRNQYEDNDIEVYSAPQKGRRLSFIQSGPTQTSLSDSNKFHNENVINTINEDEQVLHLNDNNHTPIDIQDVNNANNASKTVEPLINDQNNISLVQNVSNNGQNETSLVRSQTLRHDYDPSATITNPPPR